MPAGRPVRVPVFCKDKELARRRAAAMQAAAVHGPPCYSPVKGERPTMSDRSYNLS